MSQEVKTPFQVTEVQSVSASDYIDLTLSNATKARVLKSKLLPVVTATNDGILSNTLFGSSMLYKGTMSADPAIIDTITTTGHYVIQQFNNEVGTPRDHGILIVMRISSAAYMQVIFNIRGKMFIRYQGTNGIWAPWNSFSGVQI